MDKQQEISILLEEYKTLRTEIISARTAFANAFTITAITLIGAIGLGFAKQNPAPTWLLVVICTLIIWYFIFTFGWNEGNTRGYTKRVRRLERKINVLANKRLLIWETQYGWGSLIVPYFRYPDEDPYDQIGRADKFLSRVLRFAIPATSNAINLIVGLGGLLLCWHLIWHWREAMETTWAAALWLLF